MQSVVAISLIHNTYLITLSDVVRAPGLRDEIDGFRRIPCEYHLSIAGCSNKRCYLQAEEVILQIVGTVREAQSIAEYHKHVHLSPSLLVCLRCQIAKVVHTAVHIRIVQAVVAVHCLHDLHIMEAYQLWSRSDCLQDRHSVERVEGLHILTCSGFCEVAALSRYAKGLPFTSWSSMGNSCRRLSPSADSDAGVARSATCICNTHIAGAVAFWTQCRNNRHQLE